MTTNQLSALIASATLAFSAAALAQTSSQGSATDSKDPSVTAVPERCEALTGAERERCIRDGNSGALDQSEKSPASEESKDAAPASGSMPDSSTPSSGSGSSAPAPSSDTEGTPQQK